MTELILFKQWLIKNQYAIRFRATENTFVVELQDSRGDYIDALSHPSLFLLMETMLKWPATVEDFANAKPDEKEVPPGWSLVRELLSDGSWVWFGHFQEQRCVGPCGTEEEAILVCRKVIWYRSKAAYDLMAAEAGPLSYGEWYALERLLQRSRLVPEWLLRAVRARASEDVTADEERGRADTQLVDWYDDCWLQDGKQRSGAYVLIERVRADERTRVSEIASRHGDHDTAKEIMG